jgi:glutathione S-transferase
MRLALYDWAMRDLALTIGNRNYSSWSMRAWLALEQTGAPYHEEMIWFDEDADRSQRLARSPAGRVPVLRHGRFAIWDSLAIGEYLAELFPEAGLWPSDPRARARARSLCAEMHSGFSKIRAELPMNCRARGAYRDRGPEVGAEIQRMDRIWTDTREEFGAAGPYLFGSRTLADAFFAPVACRFRTYAVPLEGEAATYAEALLDSPEIRTWVESAEAEGHPHAVYDAML